MERKKFPQPYCTDETLPHSVCCQRTSEGRSLGNWNSFFRSTNKGFNGNEICDCSRNKYFNLENRVYYNKELNTMVAFLWLGRDLGINLRENMFQLPLKATCSIEDDTSGTSCGNQEYVLSRLSNVTLIGDAIRNITRALNPDVFLMNWGHHTTYMWRHGLGRAQYDSITQSIKDLRNGNFKTIFYWKTTTPLYSCDSNSTSCHLKLMVEDDGQNPKKLGNKLVVDNTLEVFDAQHYVKLLHTELMRRRMKRSSVGNSNTTWCSPSTMNYNICKTNPLGWDSLHYYCWVNTELNRALIATMKQTKKKN